jgi:L-asparaginase
MTARISLLAVGGTISTSQSATGATPKLGAEDLAGSMGKHSDGVEIRAVDVFRMSSRSVTPGDMWTLAAAIRQEITEGADGVVVTHGTDTLEETAYALALLIDTHVPVVLTGAMRTPDAQGFDGPANLASAVAVARTPSFAAYGPVIVFQDEIHVARWATKTHATRVAAFSSPAAGPVGLIVEGRVVVLLGPPPYHERLNGCPAPTKRVELLWAVAGADGMVVDAIANSIDGLVVAGTGGGHVSPPLSEALVRLAESNRPVVLASRCSDSQTLIGTYGGPGSEMHLLSEGILSAGSLSPVKARLRLIFGLSAGMSADDLFPTRKKA